MVSILAVLAFVGSLLGAGAVAVYLVFLRTPASTQGSSGAPAEAPVSVVPAPQSPEPTNLEPMMPSSAPVTPVAAAAAVDAAAQRDDDEVDGDDASEAEERRRRRRRRRARPMRRPSADPPPPSNQPIYDIPPERVLELTMMGAAMEE